MKPESRNNQSVQSARTKFVAMAATYCLGVFNDNFFKQAAMLIAVSVGLSQLQGTATVLFAVPFILCSAYAGWFADRFPKNKVVIAVKGLELCAMLIGAVGIVSGNWLCILSMVFLMGLQSAFFSPALNGSIPELYPEQYVPKANAILKLTTTLAILAGIATAGVALDQNWFQFDIPFGKMLVASVVILVAAFGLLAGFGVYGRPAADSQKPFPWLGPIRSLQDLYDARSDRQLVLAIMADAFFYFVASITVLIINTLGIEQLGFSQTVTSLLSMSLMLGICVGSFIAARITEMAKWFRTLSASAFGMAVSLLLASATPLFADYVQIFWLSSSLIATGIFGGLFLIPVTSFLQVHPDKRDKGRVLAMANFCAFTGILLSGVIFSALVALMAPASVMAVLGGGTLIAACLLFVAINQRVHFSVAVMRRMISFALGLRYQIKVKGMENISKRSDKGMIFLPNHPALIDPVICLSVLYSKFKPRPLVDADQGSKPFVKWLLRKIHPVLIPDINKNGRHSHSGIKQALKEVATCLEHGDNIILYPSGRLYRSAKEDLAGNSGVEFILNEVPEAQVILVRTTGLWGSSFSFADGTEPSLFKHIKRYLSSLIANGLFFGPKREVTVELVEDDRLKSLSNRLAINKHLEAFYNEKIQPNSWVPYYWWQGRKQRLLPEPEKKVFSGNVDNVPESVRKMIISKIEELVGGSEIKGSDRLANDLAIDSLSLMDLAVWLENEFGMPVDDMSALATVDDCILAASGQGIEKKQVSMKPVTQKWLQGCANTSLPFPEEETITAAFLTQANRCANEIIIADQISGPKTYRELLAAIFVLKPVIEECDAERIGIMFPASVSSCIVYLACLFAGKTPVLLNWTVGIANMKHCLQETEVKHVVSAQALHKKLVAQGLDLSAIESEWLFVDEIAAAIPLHKKLQAYAKAVVMPASLMKTSVPKTAAILFTSGSESKPKAVPLTHGNIMANMKDFTSILSVKGDDRLLGMLPPFHSLGLVGTIILPLCLGLKTVYHTNPTESVTLARMIDHYKTSMLIGTPTFLSGIANAASKDQLKSLKLLFAGAEKCPDHVYDSFHSMCPDAVLCEGYGITECSPLVSINHADDPKPGTIGKVLPSIEYAIVNSEKEQRVENGYQGILLVRGPNIFSGYINGNSGKGFCQFEGHTWYNTGDFVREDCDGNLIFCGRKKRFIKLAGEMISLPAIESVLQKDFSASSDTGPTLAVEATPTDEHPEIVLFATIAIDRETANRAIRDAGLSALHNIRTLVKIDEIPVLGTGKTDYKQLKERLAV